MTTDSTQVQVIYLLTRIIKMEDIKFRVWDNVDYMSQPFTLLDVQRRLTQFTHDCTVMRFTGLTDKNGVEIYEGDIIEYGTPPIYKSSVFWSPQDFGFLTYNEILNEHTSLCFFKGYKQFAVIGNIHANPDLLDGEQ